MMLDRTPMGLLRYGSTYRLRICLLAAAVGWVPLAAVADSPHEGAWEGAFVMEGVAWPARLELLEGEDGMGAWLDLPQLGMIEEPVPVTTPSEAGPIVEIPFGLGAFELRREGEELLASGREGAITLSMRRAPERPWTKQDMVIAGPDGELPGTLYLPRMAGPHAGVVVLHGSSPRGRTSWSYRSWGPAYASMGLAALVYDKRDTAGDADLVDLAADARAAHAALVAHSGVRPEAVGLAGGSQAAWLAARVAASEAPVAFLVMSGWPAVTPAEQERQMLRQGMRVDGLAEEAIAQATAFLDLSFYVARTGRGWPLLEAASAEAESTPWGDYVNRPELPEDLAWWGRNFDFGGESDLAGVRCPVLALYGEEDWVVPPVDNADRLAAAIRANGNTDVSVKRFPEADHRVEVPLRREGGFRWPQLAPGLLTTIEAWLGEHGFLSTGAYTRAN